MLVEIEPPAGRFSEPVKGGRVVGIVDADIPFAVDLQSLRMKFEIIHAVGLVACDGECAESGVRDRWNAGNFLRDFYVTDLRKPVDIVLVSSEGVYGNDFVYATSCSCCCRNLVVGNTSTTFPIGSSLL